MNMLRRLAVATACIPLLCASAAHAAPLSPEEVVRAYADAANRHDVEGLLALYAPDVRKFKFPSTPTSAGRDTQREKYKRDFADNPDLNVKILAMTTVGNKVVSHDVVTGIAGGKTSEEITVYEIQGGQIANIVYVERQLR
jgi:hypothetical protein